MDRKLFYKLAAIALLTVLLMVPLMAINGQIAQRGERKDEVRADIARTSAEAQTLVGPVLAVRYRAKAMVQTVDPKTGRETAVRQEVQRTLLLPAEHLEIRGQAGVETRSRGIYEARVYRLNLTLAGKIPVPERFGLDAGTQLIDARALLVLNLSDLRGIENDPEVQINGRPYHFKTDRVVDMPGQSVTVDLGPIDINARGQVDFSFPLNLMGTERLAIAPTAEFNTIALSSGWPHPSFRGRFLPRSRKVSADGFEAMWEISHLGRDFGATIAANDERQGNREVLEIDFMEPVNIYLQSERAVKYGGLFIVLTFAAFFLGEILKKRPMHFMQYLLVGLALAIFFLLLIALSEHLPFVWAYLASAGACIGLLTAYLSGVFGGARPALAFGAGFTGLYGVLYGVLLSEDNSLLMGSLLLFIALGAIMMTTRRLNWYRLHSPAVETE